MKAISYNSRILNPQEQKLSTSVRELLGILHALQIYEFLIIGSPHPIHIFTDHNSHCFTKPTLFYTKTKPCVFTVLKCNSQNFPN